TAKTIWTGSPAGEPFGTSFNDVAFKVPAAFAMWPSELRVPSKSAEPVMPSSGSTSADWERSSFFIVSFACTGVSAVSVELIGPAVPSIFKLPPPGRPTDASTGNRSEKEKLRMVMLTLLYTIGLPVRDPTVTVPSFRSSLATFTFAGAPDVFSDDCADFPSEEKFQTPSRFRSRVISG